jgi:hypothetical protein
VGAGAQVQARAAGRANQGGQPGGRPGGVIIPLPCRPGGRAG